MLSPVAEAALVLDDAKNKIIEVLRDGQHQMLQISCVSGLNSLINKLNFVSGHAPVTAAADQFPPVTNFLGEEISRVVEVVPADLKPTLDEKEIFLNKVAALQSTIRDRQPETLISDFSNEPLVLRKVAKNAGLEDYENGTINIDFIERIKEGLDAIDYRAKEEEAINQELAEEEADGANVTDVTNSGASAAKPKQRAK